MKMRLPLFGCLILGLVLFCLFFQWQFPYEQAKKSMIQNFEENFPLALSIGQVGPLFPANLYVENIRVSSDSLSFRVPDLTLNPGLPSLLLGKTDFTLEDSRSSSRLQGRFQQEKNKNRLNLRLNQVEIQASSPKGFSFLLKLSGEAAMQWEGEDLEKGTGQAWVLLERDEIRGAPISQTPLPIAFFETMRAEVQLKDGMIRVKRLEASGKETRFSLPTDLQFPLKGRIPLEMGLFLQLPPKIDRK